MKLNICKFKILQGDLSDKEMCLKIGISRTQLWRAKNGLGVGQKFIGYFKKAFPDSYLDDYFF